ncbi:MAG: DUF2178 domain-containing protein [Nanobdellota archaeon]
MRKIKYKKYRIYKLLIVMLLAGIVSSFVTAGNFVIPLAAFLIAILLMFFLKKNVDATLTDERIEIVAGKASRAVFTISVILIALAGMVLIALRETYPQYLITGYVLAYLGCGILFLYVILFKYYYYKKI